MKQYPVLPHPCFFQIELFFRLHRGDFGIAQNLVKNLHFADYAVKSVRRTGLGAGADGCPLAG
jgi:hypothetical protein